MKRFLVFDRQTADAARIHSENVEETPATSVAEALQDAARAGRTTILVVPAGNERATVARITPPQKRDDE